MKRLCKGVGICLLLLSSCSQSKSVNQFNDGIQNPESEIPTKAMMHLPSADNLFVRSDDLITIDYSHTDQGYFMVKTNTTDHQRLKIQVLFNDQTYNYEIYKDNEYEVFPLSLGNGNYTIRWLENIESTRYAVVGTLDIDVTLQDDTISFVYPNQYVDYDQNTLAVDKSFELTQGVTTKLQRVYLIYQYVIDNVVYDWDKVDAVQGKFVLPKVDEVLKTNKGICFDYASLMATMLRCQNIPTKLITGMVKDGYHAWVEVYIDNVGWISPHIYFDNNTWTRIDATFDAMDKNYNDFYENQFQY